MKLLQNIMFLLVLTLTACAGNSVNAVPVSNFETDRYLGDWYEVARLDHSFERGLSNVTANYSKRDDGKVMVKNRGYNEKKGEFEDAQGKAKFAAEESVGHLKVSFFGPFYGDYIIFGLDEVDYTHAYVSGGKDNYLWLLARTPNVSESVRTDFLKSATALGYNTNDLIWVRHNRSE